MCRCAAVHRRLHAICARQGCDGGVKIGSVCKRWLLQVLFGARAACLLIGVLISSAVLAARLAAEHACMTGILCHVRQELHAGLQEHDAIPRCSSFAWQGRRCSLTVSVLMFYTATCVSCRHLYCTSYSVPGTCWAELVHSNKDDMVEVLKP